MKLVARIDFWGEGVGCFCHEAVGRKLAEVFDRVVIDSVDHAYEKYRRVMDDPKLERSAWFEFLRNGPRHTFTLPSVERGWLSRYEIGFELTDRTDIATQNKMRTFLSGLGMGRVDVIEAS